MIHAAAAMNVKKSAFTENEWKKNHNSKLPLKKSKEWRRRKIEMHFLFLSGILSLSQFRVEAKRSEVEVEACLCYRKYFCELAAIDD